MKTSERMTSQLHAQGKRQQREMDELIVSLVKNVSWHQRFSNIYFSQGGTRHPDVDLIVSSLDKMNWEMPE